MVVSRSLRFLAGAALPALAACTLDRQVQAPAGDYLSHEQLSALLAKTRTTRITVGKFNATGSYARDGTVHLNWGAGTATGTWKIYDNRFCTRYREIRQGFETCYFFRQTGEQTYALFSTDGSIAGTWLVEK
jgi:hypothetical protein